MKNNNLKKFLRNAGKNINNNQSINNNIRSNTMKRILFVLSIIVIVSAISMAQSVVGSHHDLSTGGMITDKSTDQDQVCIFCHTPHQKGMTTDPLWNHTLSSQASYGVYASSTLNATPTDIGGGSSVSNLCMSCHDGTVAVNNLGNGTATMGSGHELDANGKLVSDANLGTDLSNDHPINFTYDAALAAADGGLKDPSTLTGVKLFSGTVQCASCHNPHDETYEDFLRTSNSGSALCLKCHNK